MNDLSLYASARPRMIAESGGMIAFDSDRMLGRTIKIFSPCVSHVAGVLFSIREHEKTNGEHGVFIMEATEKCVQVTYLSEALMWYKGCVYWHPLKKEYGQYASGVTAFLWAHNGKRYDFSGLFGNMLGLVSVDFRRFICSELVGASIYNEKGTPAGGIPRDVLLDLLISEGLLPAERQALEALVVRGKVLRPSGVAALPVYGPRVRIL